jgi:SAM-dependent methyltransferase
LALHLQQSYPEILSRLKLGQNFLDIGCCVGQEIRQLVLDGATPENLYASDLHPEFLDIGYDLFKDRGTLKSTFFAADIFNSADPNFVTLEGEMDVIWAGSFLHLFSYPATVEVLKQLIKLLRPVPRSLIVGKQMGHVNAGEFVIHGSSPAATPSLISTSPSAHAGSVEGDKTTSVFRHDVHSFRKLWKDVGEQTDTKWKVLVEQKDYEGQLKGAYFMGSLSLSFCVERLS